MRIRESSAKNAPDRNDAPLVVAVISTDLWPGRAELRGFSEEARRRGWTLEEIDFVHVGRTLEPYRELLARAERDDSEGPVYDPDADDEAGESEDAGAEADVLK